MQFKLVWLLALLVSSTLWAGDRGLRQALGLGHDLRQARRVTLRQLQIAEVQRWLIMQRQWAWQQYRQRQAQAALDWQRMTARQRARF